MPKVNYSRLVPLSRKRVFALMMDIEKYPSFIPFVRAARYLERNEGGVSLARVRIGIGGLGFSYKCEIEERPFDEILIRDVAGPFEYLRTRLTFEDAEKGQTLVGYDFESRFRSRAMNAMADPVFNAMLKNTLRDVERYILRRVLRP